MSFEPFFLRQSGAAEWLSVFHASVGTCTRPFHQVLCEHRPGLCGQPGGGLARLRRLSHGFKTSLLEQWLELTAVPVTGPLHSPAALCLSPCEGVGGGVGGVHL